MCEIIINYENTENESLQREYQTFCETVKNKYSFEFYVLFRENLLAFWKKYQRADSSPEWPVSKLALRFFGDGTTGALVFRGAMYISGYKSPLYIRVLKYDTVANIRAEADKYQLTGGCRDVNIFPSLEEGYENGGMAFLVMRSAIDSSAAVEAYTLIQYLFKKFKDNPLYLNLYSDMIGESLSRVNDALKKDFYLREPSIGIFDETSIKDYILSKTGYDVLQKKTKGIFGQEYKRVSEIVRKSAKGIIEVPAAEDFFDIECDTPALLSTYAIHGDNNVNNTLMAVRVSSKSITGREEIIEPMLIDFYEVQFRTKQPGMEEVSGWVPLLYDAARLESEIIIKFFDSCAVEKGVAVSSEGAFRRLFEILHFFLESLNRGRFAEIESPSPDIMDSASLNYLFRILFTYRSSMFTMLLDDGLCDARCAMANYFWCLAGFNYFYLKFSREERIEQKKPLALLVAAHYRKKIQRGELFDEEHPYRATPAQRMDLSRFEGIIAQHSQNYLPNHSEIERILQFIESENECHLLVLGNPGTGKTSLTAFLTRLLNGELAVPEFSASPILNSMNIACIPWFIGREKSENPMEWICKQIVRLFPSFAGMLESEASTGEGTVTLYAGERMTKERFAIFLRGVDHSLLAGNSRLAVIIDGVNDWPNFFDDVAVNNRFARISFIYCSRPDAAVEESFSDLYGRAEANVNLAFFDFPMLESYCAKRAINLSQTQKEKLFEISNGYQIYIDRLCHMIAREGPAFLEKAVMIGDITALYRLIVKKRIAGNDGAVKAALLLALAREPLSREQMISVFGKMFADSATDVVRESIERCEPLLRYTETGRMEIFHRTAVEYLLGEYASLGKKVRTLFADYLIATIEDARGDDEMDVHRLYASAHAGVHLYEWGMRDELLHLLAVLYGDESEYNRMYDAVLKNLITEKAKQEMDPGQSLLHAFLHSASCIGSERIAGILAAVGFQFFHTIQYRWAIKLYRMSGNIYDPLYASNPGRVDIANGLAANYGNLGLLYMDEGRSTEAEEKLSQAVAIYFKLMEHGTISRDGLRFFLNFFCLL